MFYDIDYTKINPKKVGAIQSSLDAMLDNFYTITGTNKLLVEEDGDKIIISPIRGELTIKSESDECPPALFKGANSERASFILDGTHYTVKYNPNN